MNALPRPFPEGQRGAAAVEFALVVLLLATLLLGIVELSRLLLLFNTATEATRLGARIAVVCSLDDAAIKTRMNALFPAVATSQITIAYTPVGCSTVSCEHIKVSINPHAITTYLQFGGLSLEWPPFSTTLPRESMKASIDGVANPMCQ